MKCKYCDQELVEGKRFCPACGKENEIEEAVQEVPAEETAAEEAAVAEVAAEETPAEETAAEQSTEIKEGAKMTPGKLAVAIVAGIAVIAIVIALIVSGMGGKESEIAGPTDINEITEPTEVMGTIPPDGNPDDATCKGSYTVTDEEVIAAADTVVATMDGAELTNAELQVFYWMEAINLLNSGYAAYFEIDFTQPLDTQMFDETMTWQQYFLTCALDSWKAYQAMVIEAEEAGHVLSDEFAGYLESLPEDLENGAISSGLANAMELVQYNVGVGADMDDYTKYIEMYYTGYSYFNELYEQIELTDEEIEAYFAENEEMYAEYGITKDGEQMNVRHILVLVKGGTTDETGVITYSDEEWAACEAEAQAILDEWLAGDATEDSFAKLAMERSEDGGSSSNGGLYQGLTADTNFVENFKNWYLEEGRQTGDYGLVRTEYGYHVMYFSGSEPIWSATAEADLLSERANSILPDCVARHSATIDYSAIKLGLSRMGEVEE